MQPEFPDRARRAPHSPRCCLLLAAFRPRRGRQLQIEVTSGVRDPVPIAIVPFARSVPADGGLDVADVVQHDLEGSGRFKALARENMPVEPDAGRGGGGSRPGRPPATTTWSSGASRRSGAAILRSTST